MNGKLSFIFIAILLSLTVSASADPSIEHLGWLSGEWEMDGFKAHYTSPEGGKMFSISRYFEDSKISFFEFEQFEENGNEITLTPYPKGDRSVTFKLTNYKPDVKKAIFQNMEHDWPTQISYERISDTKLMIEVSGMQNGKMRIEKFDLTRK